LEKEPENRYQSAKELSVDLRRLAAPSTVTAAAAAPAPKGWRKAPLPAAYGAAGVLVIVALLVGLNIGGWRGRLLGRAASPHIESLAVLPLENLSRDPEQEYFADGMTEALITDLSKVAALRVISRTSVMQYKGVKKPLPQIAKELNVDGVVEGSVERFGDQVRITAQLIQASTDTHLWAESYERDLRNVMALQDDVARAIASAIKVKLTPQEQTHLASAMPINPEAYDAYLRGRFYWNRRSQAGLKKAIEYFQGAIKKDPNYALAYAGLADAYALSGGIYGMEPPRKIFPTAKAAALKALELDGTITESHTSLAMIKFWFDWDWSGAEKEFQRALELNPRYSSAHQWYAWDLAAMARFEEAIAETKRALENDPLSLPVNTSAIILYCLERRFDHAVEHCQKTLELDPDFARAHGNCGLVYQQKTMFEEAIREFKKAVDISKGSSLYLGLLGHAYALANKRAEAMKILDELKQRTKQEYIPPYDIAVIYLGLGEKDEFFAWLQKAYEDRSAWLPCLKVDPVYDPVRSDPRFQDLLRRIGLPP